MVKTRAEVKIKIKEWIDQKEEPFKTLEVQQFVRSFASERIRVSPQRLQKYISATGDAIFNKSKKIWVKKDAIKKSGSI